MNRPDVDIEESCGNIFADIELPDAEEFRLRSGLVIELRRQMEVRKLTRAAAARLLGIGQAEFIRLLGGDLRLHTAERLMLMLTAFEQDIDIVVKPHGTPGEGGRITFRPAIV